jgi:hypothetical protein
MGGFPWLVCFHHGMHTLGDRWRDSTSLTYDVSVNANTYGVAILLAAAGM